MPLVVMGDFNQRIPRSRAPRRVSEALENFLGSLQVVTSGDVPGLPSGTIDHIAVTPDLQATDVHGVSRMGEHGKALSDHDLVAAKLVTRG
jgi:endonuclease/exonuclease/phosphatase family metal-dependent hydrolase